MGQPSPQRYNLRLFKLVNEVDIVIGGADMTKDYT